MHHQGEKNSSKKTTQEKGTNPDWGKKKAEGKIPERQKKDFRRHSYEYRQIEKRAGRGKQQVGGKDQRVSLGTITPLEGSTEEWGAERGTDLKERDKNDAKKGGNAVSRTKKNVRRGNCGKIRKKQPMSLLGPKGKGLLEGECISEERYVC